MSSQLVKYEAACQALAEAAAVDEVLEIRSHAEAWRIYAQQAKNLDLEIKAARIRFRAERRLGELVKAQKETVGLAKGGRPYQADSTCSEPEQVERPPTLAEAGIDRKLSMRAQKMAALPDDKFAALVEQHAEEMRGGSGRISMDLLKLNSEADGRAHRRDLAQALSSASTLLPTGRRYPAGYIDCPWRREGGIGDRAYENHYPTMTWPEILEFLRKARDSFLPDAWAFFWIPRAHLLAPIEIEVEVTVASTGERVMALVEMPLASACAQALDMEYSTAFVWTKTDIDHPDVSGSGLIAWDQDELLLLFKRGRGLPKPAGSEKFGSNHRERPREHSRKPDFYRRMIATMIGCDAAGEPLPVLEMFARVDAAHPLPRNWDGCGNQAGETIDQTTAAEPIAEQLDQEPAVDQAQPAEQSPQAEQAPAPVRAADPAAFPPTELADLRAYRDQLDDVVAGLDHAEYKRRGLVHDWLGKWRISPAGDVRLAVLEREAADRQKLFREALDQSDFWTWQDLSRIAGRDTIDGASVRSLVGLDLAAIGGDERVYLTAAGAQRLAELEAEVDEPEATTIVASPYQTDLEDLLRRSEAAQ